MDVDEATASAPQNAFERAAAMPAPEAERIETPPTPIGHSAIAEAAGAQPANPFTAEARRAPKRAAVVVKPETSTADEAAAEAARLAAACKDIESLAAAIEAFDGCPLKEGARKTVVYDGAVGADLLVIGEAPGREEDRIGKPFVGRAGGLLDRMLAAIGRSRDENTLITNAIYWRPPGNRAPTDAETLICRPFVDRFIDLSQPKAIALMGGVAMKALLGQTGITRARGKWRQIETPSAGATPALPMFHPAFLLRRPEHKRLAWADLQALAEKLTDG